MDFWTTFIGHVDTGIEFHRKKALKLLSHVCLAPHEDGHGHSTTTRRRRVTTTTRPTTMTTTSNCHRRGQALYYAQVTFSCQGFDSRFTSGTFRVGRGVYFGGCKVESLFRNFPRRAV